MATKRLTRRHRAKLTETIVQNVQSYPSNVIAALRLSARQTNVTESQALYAYYGRPSGTRQKAVEGIKHKNPCFITVTPVGIHMNTKRLDVAKQTKRTLTLRDNLMDMNDMTSTEKVAFFDIIFG